MVTSMPFNVSSNTGRVSELFFFLHSQKHQSGCSVQMARPLDESVANLTKSHRVRWQQWIRSSLPGLVRMREKSTWAVNGKK